MTASSLLSRFVLVVSLSAAFGVCLSAAANEAPQPTPEQEKFFEEKIRPILATKCQSCHGVEKQESDLRLDSRAALLKGGATGEHGAVAGDPDKSLLLKAVRYEGDIKMPPDEKDKLSPEQIAALAEWVKMGLPWPASAEVSSGPVTFEEKAAAARKTHWALQPVARPPLPRVKDASWAKSPLDIYVLARLEEKGLAPSPEADRHTLIRRLTFDLTGLPPTFDEVEAFVADTSPDAYERLVDRLLASPAHGERWGRHWLDVARYADTKGYAFAQERKYPYSYTYRDYVIGALNKDVPYDQFITEQLAADLLPPREDNTHLAGLGFLTVGRKYNNFHDDVDDLIDATTRGLLGLTVACARCHDHKYDAIPTKDYYSLYGVFASIEQPGELPLIGTPMETQEYTAYLNELNKRKEDLNQYRQNKRNEYVELARKQTPDYLAKTLAGRGEKLLEKLSFLSLDPKDLKPKLSERWRNYLKDRVKPEHPVWGLWHELSNLPDDQFAEQAPAALARLFERPEGNEPNQINPLVKAAFAAETPASRMDLARLYGKVLHEALEQWKQQGANAEALGKLPPEQRALAEVLVAGDSPTEISVDDLNSLYNRADRDKDREFQKKIEQFEANSSAAPPRAMIVNDKPQPHNPQVLIRGNPARPGEAVPRQFLLLVAGEERKPFQHGSGRLELAQAITAADNPLTRRVIANRVWMHHFAEPLVDTPSDFGIRTDAPMQAEALDYLADRLLEEGWSLKSLHREIVLSSVYRQASHDRPECRQVDPENRLLWRMNRRRLEWEAARDSLLAVAGRLDTRMGGRPVELTGGKPSPRRAVYGFIDRQDLPGVFRVFDIASPDQSSPRRPQTTVPQQNLYLMNSPFVVEQAKALAARLPQGEGVGDEHRIAELYRLTLQRDPLPVETEIGKRFVTEAEADTEAKLNAWQQYAQLMLLTNEFMYVD